MASAFFKNFAIENNLTIDYGYMYGKYKGMFITLKETLGSTKILTIATKVGENKENAKKILGVFSSEELPKYCISNFKCEPTYLSFTFELPSEKSKLLVEFIDKFIASYIDNGFTPEIICPNCNKKIEDDQKFSIVDISGNLTMIHSECFEVGKKKIEEKKEKAKKDDEAKGEGNESYLKGLLGCIVFSLIYMLILALLFTFMQVIVSNVEDDDSFITILQYFPVLGGLAACPIIYKGYDVFKGKKDTGKYITILWSVIISSLLGSILGFIISFRIVTDYSVTELFDIISLLITGSYPAFRYGFYIYVFVTVGLSILSMVFKFSGTKENEESSENTYEKLD